MRQTGPQQDHRKASSGGSMKRRDAWRQFVFLDVLEFVQKHHQRSSGSSCRYAGRLQQIQQIQFQITVIRNYKIPINLLIFIKSEDSPPLTAHT